MELTYESIEKYLKALNKNYSVVFTFKKSPIHQLKIHYAPHVDEFYYSYRNKSVINPQDFDRIQVSDLEDISFYSGLLISSFKEENISDLINKIHKKEHFPVQNPEVLNRTPVETNMEEKIEQVVPETSSI